MSNMVLIISGYSKREAINLVQNIDLTEKSTTLQNLERNINTCKNRKKFFFGNIEIEKLFKF